MSDSIKSFTSHPFRVGRFIYPERGRSGAFQFIVLLHWRGSAQGFPWGCTMNIDLRFFEFLQIFNDPVELGIAVVIFLKDRNMHGPAGE